MEGFDLSGFLDAFYDEARERLRAIGDRLIRFERGEASEEDLNALKRDAHTIKGSALMLGVEDIGKTAHVFEDAMAHLLAHPEARTKDFLQFLFELYDALEARLADRESTASIDAEALRRRFEALKASASEAHEEAPSEAEASAPMIGAEEAQALQTEAEAATFVADEEEALRALAEAMEEDAEAAEEEPEAAEGQPEAPRAQAPRPGREGRSGRVLRVDAARLEQLANQIMEVSVVRHAARAEFARAAGVLQRLQALDLALARAIGDRDWAAVRAAAEGLTDAVHALRAALDRYDEQSARAELMLEEVRDALVALQLRPLDTVFAVFPRAVRDAAAAEGKRVRLRIEGADVRVDRTVAEALVEPLVHLLQNAVVHGIEPPEERAAKGKPEEGEVRVCARQIGAEIEIEVADDGRGIDVDEVRRVAIARGVTTEAEAAEMDRTELLELIFRPGFTTRERTADLRAGRGIGMYAVQQTVRRFTGSIRVETEPGKGTRFILRLPVSVTLQPALLCRIGQYRFAILAHLVEAVAPFRPEQVETDERDRAVVRYRGAMAPLVDMRGLLKGDEAEERAFLVFAEHLDEYVAIVVHELLEETEVLVRELDPYLARYQIPGVMGTTVLADGSVVFLIEPAGFKEMARTAPAESLRRAAQAARPAEAPRKARVLLVEDSLIAREVERKLLEAAGFHVETAIDGLDAVDTLSRTRPDLVITDLEMPRLDGFGLIRRIKSTPAWRELPVVVISTRDSDEDRARAEEAGAERFLVKQKLTPELLRETVESLLAATGA